MEETIRELARSHGHDSVPDTVVTEVKRKLSESYIDDILDGSGAITPTTSTTSVAATGAL